jgi:acetyltransferase-like isoleucine patch superfamily enzyme
MKVVQPDFKTSLLLNRNYQAFGFCTARAAIRHFITGRVKGLDAENNTHGFETWITPYVQYYKDQPALRSASQEWAIPTVLVCTNHFGFHPRKGDNVTLKTLFNVYKGTCQFCLKPIPYSQATKDHLYPKSKGGTNHDFNMVLACRKCNSEKDNIFPYYDINGNEVKPRKLMHSGVFIPDIQDIREEWKPFLYM